MTYQNVQYDPHVHTHVYVPNDHGFARLNIGKSCQIKHITLNYTMQSNLSQECIVQCEITRLNPKGKKIPNHGGQHAHTPKHQRSRRRLQRLEA